MAGLPGWGDEGGLGHRESGSRASVPVSSEFRWKLDVLKQQLAVELCMGTSDLEVEDISTTSDGPRYLITWLLDPGYIAVPDESDENPRLQTGAILLVFNSLEKLAQRAQRLEEPLDWLLAA